MSVFSRIWIRCSLVALLLCCGAAGAKEIELNQQEIAWIETHRTIRFSIDPEWQPIEYSSLGQARGLTPAYLEKVASAVGLKLKFVNTASWGESVANLVSGKVDILPGVADFELPRDTTGHLLLTTPYYVTTTVAVTGARTRIISNFDDFISSDIIAIRSGGAYEAWVSKNFPAIRILRCKTTDDVLKAVVNGSATAAIGPEPILHSMIRQRYDGVLYIAGTIQKLPVSLRMGTNAVEPELVSIIQKAVSRLSAEDADEIQRKWVEVTDFGKPSARAILRYYGGRITIVAAFITMLLIVLIQTWRARQWAVDNARQKERFVAIMSHEIRTPLNYILASIELAGSESSIDKIRRHVSVARDGAEFLYSMLNNILDSSRIQLGKLKIECRPANVAEIVDATIATYREKANRKGLSIFVSVEKIDAPVLIDEIRVRQVLGNIISNSIKFTHRGSVSVSASVKIDRETGKEQIIFTTTDTGVGISNENINNLFMEFGQLPGANRHGDGIGSGLGLLISRDLVRAMGGRLFMDSAPGVGTTVQFNIPIERGSVFADKKLDERNAGTERRASDCWQILVVDDVRSNCESIGRQLEVLGFKVTFAETGHAALQNVNCESFEAILLDCRLPDKSGYDVAKKIRAQNGINKKVPIIGISADTGLEHVEKCLASGMDAVLFKPIKLAKLAETLGLWFAINTNRTLAENLSTAGMSGSENRSITDIAMIDEIRSEIMLALFYIFRKEKDFVNFHLHRLKGILLRENCVDILHVVDTIQCKCAQSDWAEASDDLINFIKSSW